ncbi:MAG: enoyl-CoA hydratase/isomerase family protein [Verrucomicrobia bacterium]|nr:enoyl-CoA hydratase/isomerase family protein [Verrucomicrobiota bacterium]
MDSPILIAPDPAAGTLTLTLNRPDRRNALNLPLLYALRKAVLAAPSVAGCRALVLRGAGPAFCAGMDLKETADAPHETAEAVRDALLALARCPLVTIAAVQGAAVAGGAGLAAACDFVLLADDARIGFPEVKRGLVAALVAVFLRRQLRERDLRELLLLGELLPASRAVTLGLANRAVPAAELAVETQRLVQELAGGGPHALAATKALLHELWPSTLEADCARALAAHRDARDSAEAREGAAAFLEKRPPAWAATSRVKH